MDLFKNTSFRIQNDSLDMLWLKQQVISHNIANAETPGYKAMRVEFAPILDEATRKNKDAELLHVRVFEDNTLTMRLDGNSVDIEKESLEFSKVQIQYEYLLRKIGGQFTTLKNVINGR